MKRINIRQGNQFGTAKLIPQNLKEDLIMPSGLGIPVVKILSQNNENQKYYQILFEIRVLHSSITKI